MITLGARLPAARDVERQTKINLKKPNQPKIHKTLINRTPPSLPVPRAIMVREILTLFKLIFVRVSISKLLMIFVKSYTSFIMLVQETHINGKNVIP